MVILSVSYLCKCVVNILISFSSKVMKLMKLLDTTIEYLLIQLVRMIQKFKSCSFPISYKVTFSPFISFVVILTCPCSKQKAFLVDLPSWERMSRIISFQTFAAFKNIFSFYFYSCSRLKNLISLSNVSSGIIGLFILCINNLSKSQFQSIQQIDNHTLFIYNFRQRNECIKLLSIILIFIDYCSMAKKMRSLSSSRRKKLSTVSKCYNSVNVARDINTKIRKPMDQHKKYKRIFKKIDNKLYRVPKHKITDPLFILKLHAHLSPFSEHLDVFCKLTDAATSFINQKNIEIENEWKKFSRLYTKKFKAFKMLIDYLRETKQPSIEKTQQFIKLGIYGESKNKYTNKIKATVKQCISSYHLGLIVQKI